MMKQFEEKNIPIKDVLMIKSLGYQVSPDFWDSLLLVETSLGEYHCREIRPSKDGRSINLTPEKWEKVKFHSRETGELDKGGYGGLPLCPECEKNGIQVPVEDLGLAGVVCPRCGH